MAGILVKTIRFPWRSGRELPDRPETEDQVVLDRMLQALLVARGTRVYHPELGSGLHQYLFEPSSRLLAAQIQAEVRRALRDQVREVRVQDVTVTPVQLETLRGYDVGVTYIRDGALRYLRLNVGGDGM